MEEKGKSFRQMYEEAKAQPTAVELFMRKVADDLGYARVSVRAWLSGCQTPGKGVRAALALKFGTTPEALFPEWAEQERRRLAGEPGEGLCDAPEDSGRPPRELDGTAEAAGTGSGTVEERLRRLAEAIEARSAEEAEEYGAMPK